MKRSKMKIATCIFSVAVLFAVVGVQGQSGQDVTVVNATTQTKKVSGELSLKQLREIALKIVPGKIVKEKYDFDVMVGRIVEFDIIDKNGVKREIELVASNGKVWDIDYDYDNQGNRFINQNLFTVKFSFEQAQEIATKRVPGTVLAHKQDVDRGKFIYEFIIRGTNGGIFEVDVETETGMVIKVEREDEFDFEDYYLPPVVLPGGVVATPPTPPTPQVPSPVPAPSNQTPSPNHGAGQKSEAELRAFVLSKFPGTVIHVKQDWDDGMLEYNYKIRQNNGMIVEVEVTAFGWIKDVDYDWD